MRRAALALAPLALLLGSRDGPPAAAAAPSFEHEVLPLLQRQGCASAYCHGSANGRGGFKLSLFGSEPRADWLAIARDLDGRRVDWIEPQRSLLLAKPSLRLPHRGGRRLPRDSAAYAVLQEWIAAGAPDDVGRRAVATLRLERRGDRVRALATWDNGGEPRDVTHLATLSASDPELLAIDAEGRIAVAGHGRAWVFARYGTRHARLEITRAFPQAQPPPPPAAPGSLDATWLSELAALGLRAAPPAPATALARRLHLDLVGRPPTPAELETFLTLPAAERAPRTAARLVGEPAFARVWGGHLATWLELPEPGADAAPPALATAAALRQMLRGALAAGDTLEQIARRLLLDDGRLLALHADPRDRAEHVGRAFLGLRIGCARCHDHPLDRWRRSDHLAFAAFFADDRPDPAGGMQAGKLFHPNTGASIAPRLLELGATAPTVLPGTAREQLAHWIVDAEHATLHRNLANRVFAALLGRGLVDPPDDHRATNPAVLPALLEHLAGVLRDTNGDLRALVVAIASSRAYACDSVPEVDAPEHDRAARRFFARREARPLEPQRLCEAVAAALGVAAPADLHLPRSPLARQLALLNGPLLDAALGAGGTTVDALIDFGGTPAEQLDGLFRAILSRSPCAAERERFLPLLEPADRRAAARDLARALLASREFGSLR
jgi:hypothetical protein